MVSTSALRGRAGLWFAGAVLVTLVLLAVLPHAAPGAPSSSALRSEIDRQRGRERQLSSTADRLGALEASASKAVAAAQKRLDEVQQQYDRTQARLKATTTELRDTRARLVRLRRRLGEGREMLAESLRARYTADPPGMVEVVLNAKGFNDLLEQVDFLKRIQSRNTDLLAQIRVARDGATKDEQRLATLRTGQVRQAEAVTRQRDAMSSMTSGLEQRRASLAEARQARLSALSHARGKRQSAERTLSRLQAAQARAARQFTAPAAAQAGTRSVASSGGGGSWAIPWAIVQCESGGQNVGPNYMGASGYYQFMVATWKGLGGSTPQAYQASKAEQDRLAAKLWAGGAGARNWDCAAIVGIV